MGNRKRFSSSSSEEPKKKQQVKCKKAREEEEEDSRTWSNLSAAGRKSTKDKGGLPRFHHFVNISYALSRELWLSSSTSSLSTHTGFLPWIHRKVRFFRDGAGGGGGGGGASALISLEHGYWFLTALFGIRIWPPTREPRFFFCWILQIFYLRPPPPPFFYRHCTWWRHRVGRRNVVFSVFCGGRFIYFIHTVKAGQISMTLYIYILLFTFQLSSLTSLCIKSATYIRKLSWKNILKSSLLDLKQKTIEKCCYLLFN